MTDTTKDYILTQESDILSLQKEIYDQLSDELDKKEPYI